MKLYYQPADKPKLGQIIVFAIQQLLAIMAATLVVPVITGNGMSPAAALFGAGVGTLVYVLFTKRRSPVFLGSSFAFLGSMAAAFAGAATVEVGYLGLIIGAVLAGLVYVIIALFVKIAGVEWLNKLKGRTPCVHFKDLITTEEGKFKYAPVGAGELDFDAIIETCKNNGVEYAFVEQDDCYGEDPFKCLKQSFDYLTAKGLN